MHDAKLTEVLRRTEINVTAEAEFIAVPPGSQYRLHLAAASVVATVQDQAE